MIPAAVGWAREESGAYAMTQPDEISLAVVLLGLASSTDGHDERHNR